MNTGKSLPDSWKFNPPGKIRVIDVRSLNELKRYENDWNNLLLQSTAASHMLSYQWISAYLETKVCSPAKTWICLFAYYRKKLIGVLPLIINKKLSFCEWSIIFFATPYDVFHTSSVDCLTLQKHEDVLELFIDYLWHIPHVLPVVHIKKISGNSPSMIYLKQAEKNICIVPEKSGAECFLPISGSYDAYLSKLSPKFKKELRRRSRRLNELKGIRFLLRENKRSVNENIKRLIDIEGKGWKGKNKTSINARQGDAALHTLGIERLDKCGWMDWNFLEAENKTIAVFSASRINRIIYGMKSGFDESFAFYTPGNLLFQRMVQYAFDSGDVDEINCMSEMPWQKRWKMNRRLLYNLVIFPNIPVFSRLFIFLLRVRKVLKKNGFWDYVSKTVRMLSEKI